MTQRKHKPEIRQKNDWAWQTGDIPPHGYVITQATIPGHLEEGKGRQRAWTARPVQEKYLLRQNKSPPCAFDDSTVLHIPGRNPESEPFQTVGSCCRVYAQMYLMLYIWVVILISKPPYWWYVSLFRKLPLFSFSEFGIFNLFLPTLLEMRKLLLII